MSLNSMFAIILYILCKLNILTLYLFFSVLCSMSINCALLIDTVRTSISAKKITYKLYYRPLRKSSFFDQWIFYDVRAVWVSQKGRDLRISICYKCEDLTILKNWYVPNALGLTSVERPHNKN